MARKNFNAITKILLEKNKTLRSIDLKNELPSLRRQTLSPLNDLASSVRNLESGLLLSKDHKRGRLFIFFGMNAWKFRSQRPQHIAKCLAIMGHTIVYISPNFIESPEPGYSLKRVECGVYELTLQCFNFESIHDVAPHPRARTQLLESLDTFFSTYVNRRFINILQHPFWYPIASATKKSSALFIYDQFDNIEGFPRTPAITIELEKRLIKNSDLILCSSGYLLDATRKKTSSPCYLVRNACDFNHFDRPKKTKNKRIIGYFGAIEEWLDTDLLRTIAKEYPDSEVQLIGQDLIGATEALSDVNNIFILGEKAYQELPEYLYSFSVCIIPFKINNLTLATDPVKLYEYLSSGNPVVSVDLPEVREAKNLVYIATNYQEFIEGVHRAFLEHDEHAIREQRKEFSRKNTWQERGNRIIEIVDYFNPE